MTIAQDELTANAPPVTEEEIVFPTGEFWSDEPPVESDFHLRQIFLLIQCLEWVWSDRDDYFATGNLTIYYSPNQRKSEFFRGPDFFVVKGTTRNQNRRSWVVWQEEGKYPNVIIEILSESTARLDRDEKKRIYQDTFRTPDYFWFDPVTLEFQGFTLLSGTYRPIEPNERGWLWSEQLGLYLGVHEGKLRYFTTEGQLVPTPEEAANREKEQKEYERQQKEYERQQKEYERQQKEHERQQKEHERQQKEIALQQVEELKARLRELGIEPEDIP